MNAPTRITAVLLLALAISGCSSDSDRTDSEPVTPVPAKPTPPTGKHFAKTCGVGPYASDTIIELRELTSPVSQTTGTADWFTTTLLTDTSKVQKLKVRTTENSLVGSRQQDITFYAGLDTLVLTVQQAAFNYRGGTNTGQPYDTPSDEPAY